MKNSIKQILAFAAIILIFGNLHSERNRLVMTLSDGTLKVYDTDQLTKMTFDSVATVSIGMELESAAGYTLDIKVEKPADCTSYTIAVAPRSMEVTDWYSYIQQHPVATMTESGTVKIGSLSEKTDYIVGALATDKYDIPCGISTIEASTIEAKASEKPKIGYLLFDDGTWAQRAQAGKTPVGVIFSLTPSESDRARGFTHGYALALKNASQKVKWANSILPKQTGKYTSETEYGFQTDMDGLSHTEYLLSQGSGLYPAAEAAVAYSEKAPSGSSGWYLPSSGQWFEICVNLGGLNREMPRLGTTEGYWNGLSDCNNSTAFINTYMSLAGADNYEPIKVASGDYQWFWTSSESGEEQAYVIFFDNDQLVVEIAGYFKNYDFSTNRVRSVLAF